MCRVRVNITHVVFFPQNIEIESNLEETISHIPSVCHSACELYGIAQTSWPGFFKIVNIIKEKGMQRNFSGLKENKETRQIIAICHLWLILDISSHPPKSYKV